MGWGPIRGGAQYRGRVSPRIRRRMNLWFLPPGAPINGGIIYRIYISLRVYSFMGIYIMGLNKYFPNTFIYEYEVGPNILHINAAAGG
jgi:hypothetical protein